MYLRTIRSLLIMKSITVTKSSYYFWNCVRKINKKIADHSKTHYIEEMIEYLNSIIRKTVIENNKIQKESFLKQYLPMKQVNCGINIGFIQFSKLTILTMNVYTPEKKDGRIIQKFYFSMKELSCNWQVQ